MMEIYRQGDVLIIKVKELPQVLTKVQPDKGRNILAYGEVTGHAHALPAKTCLLQEDPEGKRFLTIPKIAKLTHEEHNTITLPRGNYQIIQQVEYQREFRQVVD